MILNKDGRLVSQGTCPTMAQIMPRLEYQDADKSVLLHLTAPGMPELVVEDPGLASFPGSSARAWERG